MDASNNLIEREFAEYIHTDPLTVLRARMTGRLRVPCSRIGRTFVYSKTVVDKMIEAGEELIAKKTAEVAQKRAPGRPRKHQSGV